MARGFNATPDYISLNSAVVTTVPMTIGMWIYPKNVSVNQDYFEINDNSNTLANAVRFEFDYAADLCGIATRVGGSQQGLQVQPVPMTNHQNQWQYVACTLDGSYAGQIYFQYGTSGIGPYPCGTQNSPLSGLSRTVIGGINSGTDSGNYAIANLADVAVWNVVLSTFEISGLIAGIRPFRIRPKNLAAWWPLDGYASLEVDLSGNKFNGTLTGTTQVLVGPPFVSSTPRLPRLDPSPFLSMPPTPMGGTFFRRNMNIIGY
jgi:hypothetical protein